MILTMNNFFFDCRTVLCRILTATSDLQITTLQLSLAKSGIGLAIDLGMGRAAE